MMRKLKLKSDGKFEIQFLLRSLCGKLWNNSQLVTNLMYLYLEIQYLMLENDYANFFPTTGTFSDDRLIPSLNPKHYILYVLR